MEWIPELMRTHGDWLVPTAIVGTALLAFARWAAPHLRRMFSALRVLTEVISQWDTEQWDRMEDQVDAIRAEISLNGGESMKDQLLELAMNVKLLTERIEQMERRGDGRNQ